MVDDKVEMSGEGENFNATSTSDPKNVQELTQYVQSLLQAMQDRFQTMAEQINGRIDDMGSKIDDLERNIADIMTQSGYEGPEK